MKYNCHDSGAKTKRDYLYLYIIVDKNPAYPSAVYELINEHVLNKDIKLRQTKYLNNITEYDHRFIKKKVLQTKLL